MTTAMIEQFETISRAASAKDALRISGELGEDSHYLRLAYIRAILGPRATGGFFEPTRKNVQAKFVKAWERAHERA